MTSTSKVTSRETPLEDPKRSSFESSQVYNVQYSFLQLSERAEEENFQPAGAARNSSMVELRRCKGMNFEVDGFMGRKTTRALKRFLKANDCNPYTWEDFVFPPLKALTNGLEWFAAPATGWDRGTKAALKML